MQTVQVNTLTHSYPIYIGNGLLENFSLFQPYIGKKAAIVTNETIAKLYLEQLIALFIANNVEVFVSVLPDGEQYKNHQYLNQIYDALLHNHADRKTTIVALGGGVIGDMAGFAAATYQRGVPFIQVPTTLLSQVDSSVGGKTAINHPLGKNMIGAFYQPQLVVADLDVLATLPSREFSAGMAEVVKYALLGDVDFLEWLEQYMPQLMNQEIEFMAKLVAHCCQMKAQMVAQDETEQGIRAHLNLGHTFAHAIETEMGYGNWLHGEAVSVGMVLAGILSERLGHLSDGDVIRIATLLKRADLPVEPPIFAFERWMAHMKHDKKVQNGKMRFIGLKRLGEAYIAEINEESILKKVLAKWLA